MASNGKMGANGGVIRHSSFKGRIVFSTWKGVPRVSVQPIRRKKKISPRQREAIEKFKEAAELAKLCAPSQQVAAYRQTKGTQYFPRDVLYMAFYGRLATIVTETGRRIYSVAAKSEVSEVLDAIAQVPGSIMYRTQGGWEMLLPGDQFQVLTMFEGFPRWLDGGGGAGGGYFTGATWFGGSPAFSSSNFATKGSPFIPSTPIEVQALSMVHSWVGGAITGFLTLARIDTPPVSGEIVEIVWQGESVPLPIGGIKTFTQQLETPVVLEPGVAYALLMTRSDGGLADRVQPLTAAEGTTAYTLNAPVETLVQSLQYNTKLPAIGMTPSAIGAGLYTGHISGVIAG